MDGQDTGVRNDWGGGAISAPLSFGGRVVRALRNGSFLTRRFLLIAAGGLVTVQVALLGIVVAFSHGAFGSAATPNTTDFISFYAAGRLAQAGTPALAYDHAAHGAIEQAVAGAAVPYIYFYYPPIYLLLCRLFAALPYLTAFVAFQAVTLLACLATFRRILGASSWRAVLPLLAFTPAFWTMGLGQNAFLTAALFGGATLLVDRRPFLAGLLFGAVCYKPHFGLLLPVALAAGGHWRAFLGAGASVAVLAALSLLLFGTDTWAAYLAAMAGSQSVYVTGHLDFAAFISPFGVARAIGLAPWTAYGVQATATGIVAALVGLVWWLRLSLPVRATVLAAATPVAIPVALIYDLTLTGVAMAWLVRLGQQRGFPPWHRTALALRFIWPLFGLNLDPERTILAPATTSFGVLVLALCTAWLERRDHYAALPGIGAGLPNR
jgi:alpha-1,2-mannosyltransferase